MTKQRELDSREANFVKLIRSYEEAIEQRRLTFGVKIRESGIPAINQAVAVGILNVLSMTPIKDSSPPSFEVRFEISEFEIYLHYVASQAGMAFLPNYQLCFPDGFRIEV